MFANNNQFSFCIEFRFIKNISVRFHLRFYLYLLSFRPAKYRRLPLCKHQNLTSRTPINLPRRAASTKATLPYLLLGIYALRSSRFKLKSWKTNSAPLSNSSRRKYIHYILQKLNCSAFHFPFLNPFLDPTVLD